MYSKKQFLSLVGVACLSLMQVGCSISYSLEKSSDSVSASLDSFTSISTSSSGGEDDKVSAAITVYQEDVAAVTVLYVSRNEKSDEYQRQVSSIARNHGISDWEQERSTYIGMGKGLRRAGVSQDSITSLPYFSSMVDESTTQYSELIKGYLM